MTERTLTGNVRRRPGARPAARRGRTGTPGKLANFGPIAWTGLLLTFSVALAAAAVFTHKPL